MSSVDVGLRNGWWVVLVVVVVAWVVMVCNRH